MSDNSFFIQGLKEYGFDPTDEQIEKFIRYYDLIIEWNEKINLTAITEYKDVMIKHFLDSVSIIKAVDMSSVNSLIDIGTGAGFPGIPIKIMFPDIKVYADKHYCHKHISAKSCIENFVGCFRRK